MAIEISQKRSSFKSDSLALMGGQILITFFSLGISVITARALNADGKGQFTLALLLPSMLFIFSEFGLGVAGTRLIASGRWNKSVILGSHALAIVIRAIGAGLIGVTLVLFYGDILFQGVPINILFWGLLLILPRAMAGSILPLLLGIGLAKTYNRILILSTFLSFCTFSIGWVLIGINVQLAILMELGNSFIIAVVIWRKTSQALGGLAMPSFRYLKEAYSFGMGIYSSSVLTFANTRLIWFLVNHFAGVVGVGIYSIAQTASERIYLVADALGTILFPRIAEDPENNSSKITPIVFRIALVTVAGLAIAMGLVADWLIRFLFTDSFAGAIPILRLLLVAVVFSSGYRVLSQDLNGRGYSWVTAVINGVSATIGLGLSLLLLPKFGIAGAAWSAIASSSISLLLCVFYYGYYGQGGVSSLFLPSPQERHLIYTLLRRTAKKIGFY
jgi:O-antigen/teichoic acid export membrane protein